MTIEIDESDPNMALAATPFEAQKALAEVGLEEAFLSLTDRQQAIYRFRMRGLAQATISNVVGISQPQISRELRIIREHFKAHGSEIDQPVLIGETMCLYDEVLAESMKAFATAEGTSDKMKCLAIAMQAQDKKVKLLMDVGRLERAGTKSTVEITTSPLLQGWSEKQKSLVALTVAKSTFDEAQEPTPPEEDIADAEYTDV